MEWIPLTSPEQLDQLIQESNEMTVAIFKHSTRCGISRVVLRQFEMEVQDLGPEAKIYLLDLLKYRSMSDQVARKFGVMHQSPQLIVLKGGSVTHHASHDSITAAPLA